MNIIINRDDLKDPGEFDLWAIEFGYDKVHEVPHLNGMTVEIVDFNSPVIPKKHG